MLSATLVRSQMVAEVNTEHEFANKKTLTYDEFFSQELVMFKPGYFHREKLDDICRQKKLTANFSFETNLLAVILKNCKARFCDHVIVGVSDRKRARYYRHSI